MACMGIAFMGGVRCWVKGIDVPLKSRLLSLHAFCNSHGSTEFKGIRPSKRGRSALGRGGGLGVLSRRINKLEVLALLGGWRFTSQVI